MHSNENMSLRKTLSFHVVRWALATASPCSSQLDQRCKLRGSSWLLQASLPSKKPDFSVIPLQTRIGQNWMNRLRGVARRDLSFLLLAWAIGSLLPGCQSALCVFFSHVFRPSFLKNRNLSKFTIYWLNFLKAQNAAATKLSRLKSQKPAAGGANIAKIKEKRGVLEFGSVLVCIS